MNILFLTPSFLPRTGGVERHVAAVSRELVARGHNVTIITASNESPGWDFGTVICMPAFTGPWRLVQIWQWLWRQRRWWQQADIVHGHDFPSYYWTAVLRLLTPRPFYLTFHGWEGFVPPRRFVVFLRRWAERGTRGSIAVGQFIAKWYGQNPNFVTYGGVDIPEHQPTYRRGAQRAVFVGQLREDTGIRTYLDAYDKLAAAGQLRHFDIFGDGPLRAELEAAARRKKLAVVFHGPTNQPMRSFGTGRYAFVSGYLGMLEALAAGSLVVATYANFLKADYLRLSPFHPHISEAASASEIVAAITALQQRPAVVRRISQAGEEFATKQTWARVAETYEQLWLTRALA